MTPGKGAVLSRYRLPLRAGLIAAIILLLGWALWSAVGRKTLAVAFPSRGLAVQTVYATGTVEASVTVRIAPQVSGRIVELAADEGQTVKAGSVLARLDDSDIRATVAELEARARYADQQFERVEALLKQGWVMAILFRPISQSFISRKAAARFAFRRMLMRRISRL